MKRKFLALLALTALLFALFSPPATGAAYDGIYCIAINDMVLRDMITVENMPFPSGGYLYVPYTVFDGNANGEFELSCNNNRTNDTLTIFTKQKALIFNIGSHNSTDNTGAQHSARAISRDGRVFVPVRFVCDFFELTYSYLSAEISGGTIPIVRISNSLRIVPDDQFASAVSLAYNISDRVAEYQRSLAAATPTPTQPTPTVPVTPPPTQTTAPPPVTTGDAPPDHSDIAVYLAFSVTGDTGGLDEILNTLSTRRVSALFLFAPDELAERGGEVRHVLGRGHQVGLLLGEDAQDDYDSGARLLAHLARTETRMVTLPSAAQRADGWAVWTDHVDGRTDGSVNTRVTAAMAAIAARRSPVRVGLGCAASDVTMVSYLLRDLLDERYDLRPVTEASLLPVR